MWMPPYGMLILICYRIVVIHSHPTVVPVLSSLGIAQKKGWRRRRRRRTEAR